MQPTVYGCPQVGKKNPFSVLISSFDASFKEIYSACRGCSLTSVIPARAGTRTATPATGWRRRPGAGRKLRSSVKGRTASCCTSETCEQSCTNMGHSCILLWTLSFGRFSISSGWPALVFDTCLFRRSYEQAHFTVALSGKTGFWWIGLRAHGLANGGVDYVWDNGLSLTFTHWDKDQPGTDRTLTLILAGHDDVYAQ